MDMLNVRFPCVGGNETPLSTDWSSKDQMVPSSCHIQLVVHQNKSPPLLKRLLQLLHLSPSHQTTRITNGLTQTILGQRLDRAYFCVGIDRFYITHFRCLLQKYVCTSDLQPTLLVYFFATPLILFSRPVIKICGKAA